VQLVAENAPFRVIDAHRALVSAPIDVFDPLLFACAKPQWQMLARVIATALGKQFERGARQAGDLVLFARARALAELGRLQWRGDLSTLRSCEVRLPPHP
jgi:hypothetical protein